MKKILLALLLLLSRTVIAQQQAAIDETGTTDVYRFITDAVINSCDDANGTNPKTDNVKVVIGEKDQRDFKFIVEKKLKDGVVIKFILFDGDSDKKKDEGEDKDKTKKKKKEKLELRKSNKAALRAKYNGTDEAPKYFILTSDDFQNKTEPWYSTAFLNGGTCATGGVVVLPTKIRPRVNYVNDKMSGFDFSKDITLGLSIGIKQRVSHRKPYFINYLFSTGIADVSLDSFSTKGKITTSLDVPALTLAGGVVVDYSVIQFGIFVGADMVSDKNKNNWIYQGKPWLSIGIGYSIFSVSSQQSNKPADSQ